MSEKIDKMIEEITDIDHVVHKASRGARALYIMAGLVFAITVITLVLVWNLRNPTEVVYSPLAEYPVQEVIEETHLDGIAYVGMFDPITIRGTKCVDAGEHIEITGVVSWQPIDPLGPVIEVGTGTRIPEPGCTTTIYENVIPFEVRVAMIEQFNNGIVNPTWRITGRETPVDVVTGDIGTSKTWYTENFIVNNDPTTIPERLDN